MPNKYALTLFAVMLSFMLAGPCLAERPTPEKEEFAGTMRELGEFNSCDVSIAKAVEKLIEIAEENDEMSAEILEILKSTVGTIQKPAVQSWAHYKIAEFAMEKDHVKIAAEELAEIIRINGEAKAHEMELRRMERMEKVRVRDIGEREVKKDKEYRPGPIPKEKIEQWEYKLNKRENELSEKERILKEKEKRLQKWENELREKSKK
jgi:hypothetical protein